MNQKLGGRKRRLMEPKKESKYCESCCQIFTGEELFMFEGDDFCNYCHDKMIEEDDSYNQQCAERNK